MDTASRWLVESVLFCSTAAAHEMFFPIGILESLIFLIILMENKKLDFWILNWFLELRLFYFIVDIWSMAYLIWQLFFLPCLSLIKLENYNFGKWSQVMSNVNYFIFYEKNSVYCTYIVQMTLPCWQFCLQNTLPVVIMSFWRIFLTHNLHGIPSYLISEFIKSKHY